MRRFAAIFTAALALALGFAAFSPASDNEGAATGGSSSSAQPPPDTGIEGRIVADGRSLSGALVYVFDSFEDFTAKTPGKVSAPTGEDGKYRLDLPPGSYYLAAKKGENPDARPREGDYFSFHGSNPVTVAKGRYLHVGFITPRIGKQPLYEKSSNEAEGTLEGVVLNEGGKPVEGAYVALYIDTKEDFRSMTYASAPPTGKDGVFSFENLPEMDYYVIARKRSSGKGAGPLGDGDYFGFYQLNPVAVRAGQSARIELGVVAKAGEIGMGDSLYRSTGTRISGRVTDRDGKPAKGVYVFGYLDKVMGHSRPEAISDLVDGEGRYVLNLKEGNTYYIGARSSYGDTPSIGEWYGRWEGTGDHSVVIETGRALENVDITVEKILP